MPCSTRRVTFELADLSGVTHEPIAALTVVGAALLETGSGPVSSSFVLAKAVSD